MVLFESVLAALGLLGLYLLQSLRVRARIESAPEAVNSGCEGVVIVRVRNLSPWTVNARVSLGPMARGWVGGLGYPSVRLGRGESFGMPLVVRVPVDAPAGTTQTLVVRTRPNGFSPWSVRRRVAVRVVDVDVPSADDAPLAPAVAPAPHAAPA